MKELSKWPLEHGEHIFAKPIISKAVNMNVHIKDP